ncbi:MAG: DUF3566 domain-containing protein [Candidatus Zixiibacteriota bacterium]|nr:MAG: DUF3566 domain-containing protein [candidate division Zixibacteria bacterium]
MRYEVKSIPVWPVVKIAFFVNLIVGFLVGLLLGVLAVPFVAVLSTSLAYDTADLDLGGASAGIMMIMPFLSALWSAFFLTLLVVIMVLVYNLMAKLIGGVELHLGAAESDVPSVSSDEPPKPRSTAPPVSRPPSPPPPPGVSRPEPPPPVIKQEPPAQPATPPPAEPLEPPTRPPGPDNEGTAV